MSELRQDRITGRWVVVAPRRGGRPGGDARRAHVGTAAKLDPDCPFCPGSEARLPAILAEVPAAGTPGWRLRVVPNKYPAMEPPAPEAAPLHEVIVESPWHDADLAAMDDAQIEAVARTYRDRGRGLLRRPGVEAVVLFRNHGTAAGASLRHPHAQAVALPLTPPVTRALIAAGEARHRADGCCPLCAEIEAERAAQVRVVEETPGFLVLVPYAAEHPGEMWIAPRRHQASFTEIEDAPLAEFARLLRAALRRLARAYGDPPYNFAFDGADRAHLGSPFVHWRLRIAPRLTEWGGFELGAGVAINPSSPEDDAARLRAAGGA